MKGKSEPIVSYKVLASVPRRSPLRGLGERPLSGFVGRDRDLTQLLDLFAEARAGRGQVVGIVAEPGAGKPRLLYEFRQALAAQRVTYLEGRCLSYGSSIPYVPILDIVRQNFDLLETDREETIAEKVRRGIAEVGLDPEEWGPLLLLFLGVRQGNEHVSALTPEAIKARTFEMLRQFSLAGSKRQAANAANPSTRISSASSVCRPRKIRPSRGKLPSPRRRGRSARAQRKCEDGWTWAFRLAL